MREVIFEDTIRKEQKKRSLFIHEAFLHRGYYYTTERKTILRLKELHAFSDFSEADKWVRRRLAEPNQFRRISLLRVYNRKTGQNLWQSRLTGTIYIIHKELVLTVAFMQVYKIEVQKNLKKVKNY